ncbi:hypothetical protein MUG78_10295 [Gordonia alkaliphila]|uniref:hypothetical protein n=1 Tax=Gordonia alkaliphila TaxID=1053547 RepID=UPI001FF61B47|nr:hypothetical protein [Gordonia alkaliphila]MCK0439835.1 hypothetical protein [Gordonia alkaliphila]
MHALRPTLRQTAAAVGTASVGAAIIAGSTLAPLPTEAPASAPAVVEASPELSAAFGILGGEAYDTSKVLNVPAGTDLAIALGPGGASAVGTKGSVSLAFALGGLATATSVEIPEYNLKLANSACVGMLTFAVASGGAGCFNVLGLGANLNVPASTLALNLFNPLALIPTLLGMDPIEGMKPNIATVTLGGDKGIEFSSDYFGKKDTAAPTQLAGGDTTSRNALSFGVTDTDTGTNADTNINTNTNADTDTTTAIELPASGTTSSQSSSNNLDLE